MNYPYYYQDDLSANFENALKKAPLKLSQKTTGTYNHLTYYVQTLSEYIKIIENSPSRDNTNRFGDDIIYRGMSNCEYDLTPSLCRLKKYHEFTEREITTEFRLRKPEAFDGALSGFEQLAKMQHYGLPTRLLDFTTNPLIALYFACEKDEFNDGRVLFHCSEQSNVNPSTINTICNLPLSSNEFRLEGSPIDELLDPKQLVTLITDITNSEFSPIVAKPLYWNQRIRNQSSVFMIFPPQICDNWSAWMHHHKTCPSDLPRAKQHLFSLFFKQYDIEDLYGDGNTMFYVNSEIWQKLIDTHEITTLSEKNIQYIQDRFTLSKEIVTISPHAMSKRFISVIVPKECKHKIMYQLSLLGINEAYIYPELEYTAKQIKSYYM